jgi:molybdopterin converting factor small subunit
MKVTLKLFPISGMNSKSLSLDIVIDEGTTVADLLHKAEEISGQKIPDMGVMVILSGRAIDLCKEKDTRLEAGDWLWIMPNLSGG